MKRILYTLGLAFGLCPWLAGAQPGADRLVESDPASGLDYDWPESALHASEFAPQAAPSPDWVNVLGFDFIGYSNRFQGGQWLNDGLICQGGTQRLVTARLDIPHGRKINFFRLWGHDSLASGDLKATLWRNCLPNLSSNVPTMVALADVTSTGTPGNFTVVADLNPNAAVNRVNAHLCTYWAAVEFPTCTAIDSAKSRLRKIHVEHTK